MILFLLTDTVKVQLLTDAAQSSAGKAISGQIIVVAITAVIGLVTGFFTSAWGKELIRKSVVKKYRVFLAYSAFSLYARLDKILLGNFSQNHHIEARDLRRGDVYASNAVNYTVFLFCQYFAWREIINKELHNFKSHKKCFDSQVLNELYDIEGTFSNSYLETKNLDFFMIFRGEQRVLGDMCIRFNEGLGVYECISFTEFIKKCKELKNGEPSCHLSLDKLEREVEELLTDKKDMNNKIDNSRLLKVCKKLEELLNIVDKKRLEKYKIGRKK